MTEPVRKRPIAANRSPTSLFWLPSLSGAARTASLAFNRFANSSETIQATMAMASKMMSVGRWWGVVETTHLRACVISEYQSESVTQPAKIAQRPAKRAKKPATPDAFSSKVDGTCHTENLALASEKSVSPL